VLITKSWWPCSFSQPRRATYGASRLLKTPKSEARFHDFAAYDRLVEAAKAQDAVTHLVILLGGDAGLRCGEISRRRSGTPIRDCAARFVFFHADGPLLLAIVAAPR